MITSFTPPVSGLFCSLGDWGRGDERTGEGVGVEGARAGCRSGAGTPRTRGVHSGGRGAWVLGAAAASVPSAFLLLLPLGPPVLFPLSGLLPLACLGFCVVSSRVRFLVRGALPRTAEWASVFFLSLYCCCFALLACCKSQGPGPPKAECSSGVWGRACWVVWFSALWVDWGGLLRILLPAALPTDCLPVSLRPLAVLGGLLLLLCPRLETR